MVPSTTAGTKINAQTRIPTFSRTVKKKKKRQSERDIISRKSHNSLHPWVCQGFVLRLGVLVMAVSKYIFTGMDSAVAAVTTGLPNNVATTVLPRKS